MNKALGTAVACLAVSASLLPPTTASAQRYQQRFYNQDRFIENYCGSRWDNDCNDWRDNRGSWDEGRYHRWYGRHHDRFGPEDAAVSIFGFVAGAAAGAITGSINGANVGSHEARCSARYRSYDLGSDTFMGFDGERHYCRL